MELEDNFSVDLSFKFSCSESENEKSYRCFICDKTFKCKLNLETHVSEHTETSENDNFASTSECNINLPFKEQSKIRGIDSKVHNGNICSECGKEFRKKCNLQKHLVVHANVKAFVCVICSKRFSRKERLIEHYSVHLASGFPCYLCGKVFSLPCILRKHEMIHGGIKPFTCDLCFKKFSRKNDMERHRTSHTCEKFYFCKICEKGFSQKRLLNRHSLLHLKYL